LTRTYLLLELVTLRLDWSRFGLSTFDDSIVFPNLQRLVLAQDAELDDDAEKYHRLFSPRCMPRLVHLALDASSGDINELDQLFENILPQLQTLALSDQRSALSTSSLNLFWEDNASDQLFASPASLDLDSLHFNQTFRGHHRHGQGAMLVRLSEIAHGEIGPIRAKRVVIYGDRTEMAERFPDVKLDRLEWRSQEESSAFEDFDGK
jgi:hypothetical protein